jgi:DNA invertase Pin-like site-specific DNA recombinase
MVSTKDVATINFEKTKKVACLYRVSTKGQVDHDDIPMQKTACREFIAQHENWSIYKEYYEKGVSGYKVSAKKRDELQRVLADAQQGLFQVLLVFMFDRIGRKEDESPFLVETFVHMGIEVWSVIEGQRKIETHVDKLLNYIGFWQASGESQKTSMRVEEKHKQMVKQGEYRGGIAPYGYKLVKSGEINKKGKELYKLAIDETESEIIKKIYNLSYEEGYGSSRIANWLNEKNILTRSSKLWNISAINYIFRNPIYKGYMSYGKSTRKSGSPIVQDKSDWILSENKIEELAIIDEYTWNKVQQLRDGRTRSKREDTSAILQTKSPLLLTGMIHCGYCGSSLSTTYHSKEWTNKDGSKHRIVKPKYRCVGKAMKKTLCEGQTNYAQE